MSTPSAPITTRGPLVEYTSRFVQPPSALYLSPDDALRFQLVSSTVGAQARLLARILEPAGTVRYWQNQLTTVTARVAIRDDFKGLEGFLLGLIVDLISGGTASDWFFGSVQLSLGVSAPGRPFQALCHGYFEDEQPLFWPGGHYRDPWDGRGFMREVTGLNPGPGSQFSQSVPEGARWRLQGMEISLVTSAAAANRRFILEAQAFAGAVYFATAAQIVQTASTTFRYNVAPWGMDGDNRDGRILVNWPADVLLVDGDQLVSAVANLKLGDDFGAPTFLVEEWFQP